MKKQSKETEDIEEELKDEKLLEQDEDGIEILP